MNNSTVVNYIKKGKIEKVAEAIDNGFEVNKRLKYLDDATLLHVSVLEDKLELAKLLIEYGANISAKDGSGKSSFFYACERGRTEIAKFLLENGANMNTEDSWKSLPANDAAKNGHIEIVKMFINNGYDINKCIIRGETMLNSACGAYDFNESHFNVVRYLLENDANVNYGASALSKAIFKNNYNLTKFLLENGADPNYHKGIIYDCPLIVAAQHGYIDLIKLLFEYGVDINQVIRDEDDNFNLGIKSVAVALEDGHLEVVKFLLANGVKIKINSYEFIDLFINSIDNDYYEIIDWFLANNIHLNKQTNYDKTTPLMIASKKANLPLVEQLLEKKVKVNLTDRYGNTALIHALSGLKEEVNGENKTNYFNIIKNLIENGTNINISNEKGENALSLAIKIADNEILKYVFENENIEVDYNKIMIAACYGNLLYLVQLALDHGVDINLRDKNRNTPLIISATTSLEIVKYLSENGADIHAENEFGNNAVYYAKNSDIKNYLLKIGVEEKENQDTPYRYRVRSLDSNHIFMSRSR